MNWGERITIDPQVYSAVDGPWIPFCENTIT
jgi:hypothetical protein